MNPFLNVPEPKNPFLSPEPVAAPIAAPKADLSMLDDASGKTVVSIEIAWGDARLCSEHRAPSQSFFVGERATKEEPVDFLVPEERLGATRTALVVSEGGRPYAMVPRDATLAIEVLEQSMTLADAKARGMAVETASHVKVELAPMTKVVWTKTGLTYTASHGPAAKKTPKRFFAGVTALAFIAGSLVAHAALLGGVAFSSPDLSGDDDRAARDAHQAYMLQALHTKATPEEEAKKDDANGEGNEGSNGAQHKGQEGVAGKDTAKTNGMYAVKGQSKDPRLPSRADQVEEAKNFGLIGMLNAGMAGVNAPSSPWNDHGEGKDDQNFRGQMWAASLGDAFGTGLGLSGIGDGGGGQYDGIGLDKRGIGRGAGGDGESGIGRSHGKVLGDHKVTQPIIRTPSTTVSGRIPAEVVQRIVRQRFGSFRACYEAGLRQNPVLAGRVSVRFAIDSTGTVATVGNAGSDLPDAGVVSCVVGAFRGLSFPAPESGIVTVVYPITFSPGN